MSIDCPEAAPRRGVTELLSKLAFDNAIPLSVVIELTLRCNLRCLHCYNFDRAQPYPKELKGRELTSDEIFRVIDEVCAAGCLYLAFSGGEALAHSELLDFVRRARRNHASVRIKTNGALLSESRVQALLDAGVSRFDVSIYGASAETHDAFTLKPGSFAATMKGLEAIKRLDGEMRLAICVTRTNAHEVTEMLALEERFECSATVDTQLTTRVDGSRDPLDLRIDAATLEELYRGPLARYLKPPDVDPLRSVQCNCARGVAAVSSTGEVYPCIGAPVPSGNIRDQPFAAIWANSPELNRIRTLALSDFTDCAPCPDRPFCNRSSGVVYQNTGCYTGAEPATCADAAIRRRLHTEQSRTARAIPDAPTTEQSGRR